LRNTVQARMGPLEDAIAKLKERRQLMALAASKTVMALQTAAAARLAAAEAAAHAAAQAAAEVAAKAAAEAAVKMAAEAALVAECNELKVRAPC
jgi:hypothetical protein